MGGMVSELHLQSFILTQATGTENKKIEKAYFEASTLMEGIEPVPVAQLYEELKTKLLSEVA